MEGLRISLVGLAVVGLAGCAGTRGAQMREMQTQMAHLEGRVRVIEQQTGLVESKAWDQREDVSYLKGRVEGLQQGSRPAGQAASVKPTAKRIQSALKNAGYYTGSVDGKIGPQTKQAIKEFQRTHGLSADGKVGTRTWTQLAQYLPGE